MKNKQRLLKFLSKPSVLGFFILTCMFQTNLMADSSVHQHTSTSTNQSGATVQVLPDGSKLIKTPDNTTIEIKPDGTKLIKNADGTTVQKNADGSKVITKPDGTSIQVRPDGSKTIKKADGTTVEVKSDD